MLCHKIYRCTPEELDRQDVRVTNLHLAMWQAELEEQERRRNKAQGRTVIRKGRKKK